MAPLSAGALLVANPKLPDPNFDRTVVLVLAYGPDGSVGVILNRPGTLNVADALPHWRSTLGGDDVVFQGGPVNPQAVIGLAVRPPGVTGAMPEGVMAEVLPDVGIIDLEHTTDRTVEVLAGRRLFAGYAGWSPGQLESEVDAGGWFVVASEPGDVRTDRPGTLWRDVLRRQGGSLAVVSSFPPDPTMN